MATPARSNTAGSPRSLLTDRATGSRVPDFFIVGSPKTGTTALYRMLRRHPQIYMPDVKEPQFLAADMAPCEKLAHKPRERMYPQTLEQYLALFDGATPAQRAGEASTFYLWSRSAAERIAELQPEARIIAILREPASFLRSMHLMLLRWGVEGEKELRKAIELEPLRGRGKRIPRHSHRPQLLQYSDHVRYVDQLRRHHAHFPRERVLVLIYEDFHGDNDATVRGVLRFLDVDDRAPVDVMNVNVTTRTVRSHEARHLMYSLRNPQTPLARATKAAIEAFTTPGGRRRVGRSFNDHLVGVEAPPADERTMLELRQRFKHEVVALSEYLDRDLVSLWGYEKIA